MLPVAFAVFCYIYEYLHLPNWMIQWQEEVCRHPDLSSRWQVPCSLPTGQSPDVDRPRISLFVLKYVSMIMTGFLAATFVISGQGIETWKLFCQRLARLDAVVQPEDGIYQQPLRR